MMSSSILAIFSSEYCVFIVAICDKIFAIFFSVLIVVFMIPSFSSYSKSLFSPFFILSLAACLVIP